MQILSRSTRAVLIPVRPLSPFPIPSSPSSPSVCRACQRRSLQHISTTPALRRHASTSTTGTPTTHQLPSSSSSLLLPPPPSAYARLTSRCLISIAGPDAPRFLQGIVTQSVVDEPSTSGGARHRQNAPKPTTSSANLPGFYCGFLNAKGRVLHDVFIYRDTLGLGGGADAVSSATATATGAANGGDSFIIEVDATQAETLARHIKRYKLRSRFNFRILDPDECATWQVWDGSENHNMPFTQTTTPTQPSLALPRFAHLKSSIVLPDTRAPGMGFRVLSPGSRGDSSGLDLDLEQTSDTAYRVRRYLHGVPEGQSEILGGHALPLEANLDAMGAIDFRKGCYVGQELTIRTKHRGIVRKRILPCILYPAAEGEEEQGARIPQRLEYRPYIGHEGDAQGSTEALQEGGKTGGVLSAEDVPPNRSIGRLGGAKGRGAGTWLCGVGNIGLAMCRLPIMTDLELPCETAGAPYNPDADEFVVKWTTKREQEILMWEDGEVTEDGEGLVKGEGGEKENAAQAVRIKAFVPEWLRERTRMGVKGAGAGGGEESK
ncbi:Aminomethyltransferase folate-binding domain-containing protein [Hypoxylon fragiforme]|uniref:Aminomethyltransferase folate-binding domain-containing protein n=1 Tax=Hypoxylon fragiforme TaxID=63214 RepID=UPI0020C5D39A|nr:Aminomethyltransferase folate-binding domain-containing protein [Hypoxylon fragiforme]KAI2612742.1 Aminomethyltransferase folate-binding domain-containing protein [Hypoxylon fragiforme]